MTTRVLVVDDDPAVRSAISRALRVDYEVGEAVDGADALAQHTSSPADAIVLDLLMPEIGGLDVCRSLRHRADPSRSSSSPRATRSTTGSRVSTPAPTTTSSSRSRSRSFAPGSARCSAAPAQATARSRSPT